MGALEVLMTHCLCARVEVPFAVFLERWWVLICRVDFWFKWVSLPLECSSTVLLTWAVNIWRHVRIFNDVVDLKCVGLFNWNDKPNFPLYIGKPTAASEPMITVTAVDSSFNNYSVGLISYSASMSTSRPYPHHPEQHGAWVQIGEPRKLALRRWPIHQAVPTERGRTRQHPEVVTCILNHHSEFYSRNYY